MLVHLEIRSRGSPSLETVLLVRVLLPSKGLQVIRQQRNSHEGTYTIRTVRASTDIIGAPLLRTLNLYSSSCLSNTDQQGMETTLVLIPSALSFEAASTAIATSLPQLTIVRPSYSSSWTTYPPLDAFSIVDPLRLGRFWRERERMEGVDLDLRATR